MGEGQDPSTEGDAPDSTAQSTSSGRVESTTGDTPGIEVPGARLRILDIGDEAEEFVFILETTITDPTSPYELTVITGSSFTRPDSSLSATDAASTLLFITYPYVRELLASISGRSPFPAFTLAPLTKLPHASVEGDQAPLSEEAAADT